MEKTASICLGFPPEYPTDAATYETAVNAHLTELTKLIGDSSRPLQTEGPQLLNILDPAVNSLSYLAVLHVLLIPDYSTLPREFVSEKFVLFMVSFDSRQIRYAGQHFRDLLDLVAKGQFLPPTVAVQVLTNAILRLDPTGSMLTSTHINLVKLAYSTNNIEPVLDVIDKNIVFYPNMGTFKKPAFLNDLLLPPTAYISENSGLTATIKAAAVLEYDLLRGLMYCSRRDWPRALAALERVVAYPTRDHGTSKIMIQAYKKWLLVSLLAHGKTSPSPVSATSATSKAYNTLGKSYKELATIFETDNAIDLKRKVDENSQEWLEDVNMGLVQEVLSAYQEWQIINLQNIYTKVSIDEIRMQTKSAQTGHTLVKNEDVESLIQNMIISGKLQGVVEKNDNGVTFLTFLPSSSASSEVDFAKQLAGTAARLKALEPIFRITNERLGTSKEYIKHLSRRKNQDPDKDGDVPMDFGQQVEDENLMDDSYEAAAY